MTERKKRILFASEATFLNTGYATYTREILNYLHGTGKYELAEMASYGERNDPRAANIPWRYYGVVPNQSCEPKASRKELESYAANGTNQFGGWIFEHVCLDFKPDIVCDIRDFWMLDFAERSPFRPYFKWCFPAGTPVITDFGYSVPIEKFYSHDGCKVKTHVGNQRMVTNSDAFEYSGLMTKIKAEGMAEPVVCTEDHEILVLKRQNRIWDRQNKRYQKVSDSLDVSKKEFVPSSDIRNGDYLMVPIMELGDGLLGGVPGIPLHDDESLWILGHFLADGSAREKYRISFSFHSDEVETIKRVESYFAGESGDKLVDGNKTVLRFNGKHLAHKYSMFYDENGNKCFPMEAKCMNDRQARILLEGYFAGDGCVTRTDHNTPSIEMFSKSKILARQIADLGRALGYCLRLGSRSSQEGYTIRLSGHKCADFRKELISTESQNTVLAKKDFNRVIIKDGYFLMPVTSVECYEDSLIVYDIEVDQDHSFVTHCAVHNCIMPTVDARPQARQWISTYASADACFTYSDWAGGVLEDQSGGKINYLGSAPPSAHPAYKPLGDKGSIRESLGINPDCKIIGTVMRNQRRKLYPDLFIAFRKFMEERKVAGDKTTYYLYCHTSYPDLGWDIPEEILKNGIASNVLFTYVCPDTKKPFSSVYKGAIAQSPYTDKWGSTLSNVKNGLSYEDLAKVINCFDLYVQYANCEGFGLPQVEAAACGVPVCGTDYSAMESVLRKLGGFPIKPAALYKELETGCLRAVPDNDVAADLFTKFFSMSEEARQGVSKETRARFEKLYQWDISGKKWEDYFDSVEVNDEIWNGPPRIHQPREKLSPEQVVNARHNELARWLIINVLGEPEKAGTFFESRLTRDLMLKSSTASTGGMYFNESSSMFDGKQGRQEFSFDMAYDQMKTMCERRNHWENERVNRLQQNNG